MWAWPRPPRNLTLDYEISLLEADQGRLEESLTLTGSLERPQSIYLPMNDPLSTADEPSAGVPAILIREAAHLVRNSTPGQPLSVTREADGWLLHHKGKRRTRLVYQVELDATSVLEEDIRLHLTVPYRGGFRAAGYHLFLIPDGEEPVAVTVRFSNTAGGTLAVPWSRDDVEPLPRRTEEVGDTAWAATPSAGRVYRPADLRDLYASLLAWGDLRLLDREVAGCSLRLGLGDRWLYTDNDLAYLLTRIAKAEIAFFGSPPQPAILCLVAPNPVLAEDGFDYYGVHVGHSILLFLDPGMTYADLTERAANVMAHEMFHGWLGEAIRQEDPHMLWFVEGATTWYATRILKETGIWTVWRAESVVGERIDRNYYENELLGVVSVAEAAAGIMNDATTTRFAYAGGTLAAAALDRWLATGSGAVRPLDEVLRHLYRQRDATELTRPDLEAAVTAVTGADCSEWLDTYVYGKETLPRLESLF
jgi:hypothetical protein